MTGGAGLLHRIRIERLATAPIPYSISGLWVGQETPVCGVVGVEPAANLANIVFFGR